MKKALALLVSLMMAFSITACGNNDTSDTSGNETLATAQNNDNNATDSQSGESNTDVVTDTTQATTAEADSPTTGTPIDWPDNEYTKLVPTPDVGGKVLSSGEIGTLFAIELNWSMDQGLAYAQQLQDAGFGDDCVEKYEQFGYIDRTENGVNIQLMEFSGVTSISIMKTE